MNVAVVGLGYVGAITAACLAEIGHTVVGVDIDKAKVDAMEAGTSPIVEPRLDELIGRNRANGRLSLETKVARVRSVDALLVAVGTPSYSDGTANLDFIERVSHEIAALLEASGFPIVVYRSTVPPGTVEGRLVPLLESSSGLRADHDFGVAMVPEFLREGSSVDDFFHPPFTAAGVRDGQTFAVLERLFGPLERPVHRLSIEGAESLKYACNAFHATKITFANEIGRLLASIDVDARDVMRVFCEDDRLNVSSAYLRPGFAFGGSCLPKDLRALMHLARLQNVDVPMLGSILRSNESHIRSAINRVLDTGARHVALLGLSFKPETDDLRHSPYVEVAETLIGKGIAVKIYDPIVKPAGLIGANKRYVDEHLPHLSDILMPSPEHAVEDAEVVIVGTASPDAVAAVVRASPRLVLDLHGGLGATAESLPGYRGIAW